MSQGEKSGENLVVAGDEGGQVWPLLTAGRAAAEQVLQIDVGKIEEVGLWCGHWSGRQLLGKRLGCVDQRVGRRALLS